MRRIAVIGAGPSGCYITDQLLRAMSDADVTVVERLPVPLGLVRYGVSPDHQGTKAIARLFNRALAKDRVHLVAHVQIGQDVSLEELAGLFDAVVLAVGAPRDRRLGIPGELLPGVTGSAAFVGWYNDYPDYAQPVIEHVRSAVVIGNGNVALDVARMLAHAREEFAGSDLSPTVFDCLAAQPIETIHVVGRRGPAEAKFTTEELAELRHLQRALPQLADPEIMRGLTADTDAKLEIFDSFERLDAGKPVRIVFHFHMTPAAFIGEERLQAVAFTDAQGRTQSIPAQLAVSCIGYQAVACDALTPESGRFTHHEGCVMEGMYVIGWAARGPSGTIPTSRSEAQVLAKRMAGELSDHDRPGAAGLTQLLKDRGVVTVDFAGWKNIDAAERARAGDGRCREKFASVESMLSAL